MHRDTGNRGASCEQRTRPLLFEGPRSLGSRAVYIASLREAAASVEGVGTGEPAGKDLQEGNEVVLLLVGQPEVADLAAHTGGQPCRVVQGQETLELSHQLGA